MTGTDLFKAGRLNDAIAAQTLAVRENPGDQSKRIFLFELLSFAGEMDRARKQLDALQFDKTELMLAVSAYRGCLDAEKDRCDILEKSKPLFFSEPPEHVLTRLKGLHALGAGNKTDATKLIEEANSNAPVVNGTINGKPFSGLRDADDLFASVLEVFSSSKYYWVPLEEIASVEITEPKAPRDLIYIAAELTLKNGEGGPVFLPALYLGTNHSSNELVKMGRENDWEGDANNSFVRGYGRKVYLVGDEDLDILSWRKLEIS
jgi:type VI secretion system protein ImpE